LHISWAARHCIATPKRPNLPRNKRNSSHEASKFTAWGTALIGLLIGLIVANLSKGQGRWEFYMHFDLFLEALALSLLSGLLGVSGGVLISLHSATVRQAQQILIVATLVLVGGGVLALKAVPAQAISSLSFPQIWLIAMAVLAVLDAILLGVSLVSFRRSRLILS
jgi:hypothetical protein